MLKLIKNALSILFMSKKARLGLNEKHSKKKNSKERDELIRNAQKIHKQQQSVFKNISEKDREALAELAASQFINDASNTDS